MRFEIQGLGLQAWDLRRVKGTGLRASDLGYRI